MSKKPKIKVIEESDSGRNERFEYNNKEYTRPQINKLIKKNIDNLQDDYHIRHINGLATPCSNPDSSKNNNLN